jgi:glucan endo-1,3-alpha-glucosidase
MNLDNQHIAGNGNKIFMAAASPWFYTHYSFKNWFYGGDNWLWATRWEQLIANRDRIDLVEVISWNDYGESHYIGPIKGAQPNSEAWVNGYDHTAWLDMGKMYAQVFKSGSWSAITKDQIYIWTRPHPASAISNDWLGKPTGWNWVSNFRQLFARNMLYSDKLSSRLRIICGRWCLAQALGLSR